jgi:hypothetical protein
MEARLKLNLAIIQGNFAVHEFVSKRIYDLCKEEAIFIINPVLLNAVVHLKKVFPKRKITINNWYWGGEFDDRGYRDSKSDTGSLLSEHRFGEALDCIIDGVDAETVRQYILLHQEEFPGITRIEQGVSWLHMDTKPHKRKEQIYAFIA